MLFKDWRLLDQSSIGLSLEKDHAYYIHSRAWALKGWIGGTHSWITFWCEKNNKWLVVELTDKETIDVQQANILFIRENIAYEERTPIISDRIPDARWFGSDPIIVSKFRNEFTIEDFIKVCNDYPIKDFHLLKSNCNTFTSYLIAKLNINCRRPIRSVGFRNQKHWKQLWPKVL